MKQLFLFAALAALSVLPFTPARAQSDYPYQGHANFTVDGTVRHIDFGDQRMTVNGNDGVRYLVDTSASDIVLPSGNTAGRIDDLAEGQSVHVVGTLVDGGLIEADRVRIFVPDTSSLPLADAHADYEHIDLPANSAPSAPIAAAPPAPAAAPASNCASVDGLVREVDPDKDHIVIVDSNDNRYEIDTLGSDIILPASSAAAHCGDLARGMHVHVIGTQLSGGVIAADRVSVQTDADLALPNQYALQPPPPGETGPAVPMGPLAPVTPVVTAPVPAPVPVAQVNEPLNYSTQDFPAVDLDQCTGILIDCRDQPGILRSPAPTICGPNMELLYPDRSHVPTPDEVQEESIVRYYRTMDDAMSGVGGAHPLVLRAVAVVGPAQDGVQLSDQDMALFIALDKRLHFTQNWKVGFLVPPDK